MLWVPSASYRFGSRLVEILCWAPSGMVTSGCWSALSRPQTGLASVRKGQAKSHALVSGCAASLHGLEAGRRELQVLSCSLRQAKPVQQGPLSAVSHRVDRLRSPFNSLRVRGWSFQGLSWLWLSPWKHSASSDSREGTPAAAPAVEPAVDRSPRPPPPLAHQSAEKLDPLPDESGPILRLETGAAMIPNPAKASTLGEDAYFVTSDGSSFGVADGVGAWILSGIDSGQYSRMLMQMSELFADSKKLDAHPKQVLWAAYKQTHVVGSSTACILKVKRNQLYATNMGDSGFMVVRGSKVIFQSPQMQHGFNFPYQLGRLKPKRAAETPRRAQVFKIQLQPGDILVAATDGLLDNVFPEETAALVSHARTRGQPASAAAKQVAKYTFIRATNAFHMSPFAYAAQASGHRYVGGKLDDITVVVSYISAPTECESSSSDDLEAPEKPPPLSKM